MKWQILILSFVAEFILDYQEVLIKKNLGLEPIFSERLGTIFQNLYL